MSEPTVRSICPYCGVGCGVLVERARGRIRHVRGDPDHPTNRGGLCAKGRRLAETVRTGDRLLHPMGRERPGEAFRRLDWAEALGRVRDGIRAAIGEHGPDSVALYLSGQLLTEDYYAANKLGKGLIGTSNVDTNSRLCMSSTVAAYKRAFGVDGPPGCYEDLDHAHDVLIVGSNLADTHPILFGRLLAARDRRRVHWTVVDPRRTATAEHADEHLAIVPGSDVALLLGMASALFEEGLVDQGRVGHAHAGLDEARAAAAAMPPERAAALCGLPADRIRSAARRLARSPAALSLWCQGLNQSTAGTDKVSALINLHLLTGQLGRPGTGPFSLTGQANAMGGREVGGLATELACHVGWDDAEGRAAVERHWGLGRVPSHRGLTAVELIEAIQERRVRVLWVVCTNPMASLPDGRRARDAFRRLDLLVVQELYHPTDTTEAAHVLLPAAGWGEKTGCLTSSERRVALVRAAVPPPGEALPDWRIFAAAGAALGAPHAFGWRGPEEVFDEHVRLTAGRDLDMTALSHAVLEREGPQQWPYPAGGRPSQRRYEDGRFPTDDGRARLVAVSYRPPAEEPSPDFPLRLLTGRLRDSWHTLTRTGRVAAFPESTPAVLGLHPDDARRAGVDDGAAAVVHSRRGALRAHVAVDASLPPGSAFLPFHLGPLLAPGGWANALVGRALDPVSFQPELKHVAVRVDPAEDGVALAGGALAGAVAAALGDRDVPARLVTVAGLADVPRGMLRVVLSGDLGDGLPWWEVAVSPPEAPPGGVALLDLTAGPEPLAALPALAAAGWTVGWRGERWLPEAVRRLVAPHVRAPSDGDLLVTAPVAAAVPEVPDGVLILAPGGALGLHQRVATDPRALAAFLAGRSGPRTALRRVLAPLSRSRTLILAGDPVGDVARDAEQGVDQLLHEDRAARVAQVWRLSAGRLLGVAAVLPPGVAEDAEALWLTDPEPALVRRRFPLR